MASLRSNQWPGSATHAHRCLGQVEEYLERQLHQSWARESATRLSKTVRIKDPEALSEAFAETGGVILKLLLTVWQRAISSRRCVVCRISRRPCQQPPSFG